MRVEYLSMLLVRTRFDFAYLGPSPSTNVVSRQAKQSQNKTLEVFFHAAFDFDAPRRQNTDKK